MADNKKYYYLKLKDNFYDSEQMIILQNMQDGYLYSDILMKLYLRSLKSEGKLMFNNIIPYTPSVLAQVVRHQVGTVEKALTIFQQLGLIEVLDNGAIYMLDIQNFIGKSSSEGDRKREYRARINKEQNIALDKCPDKQPPEIEIEIEKDIYRENNISKDILKENNKKPFIKPTIEEVRNYCKERHNGIDAEYFLDFYESKGWKIGKNPMKDWKAAIRTWEKNNKSNKVDNKPKVIYESI